LSRKRQKHHVITTRGGNPNPHPNAKSCLQPPLEPQPDRCRRCRLPVRVGDGRRVVGTSGRLESFHLRCL